MSEIGEHPNLDPSQNLSKRKPDLESAADEAPAPETKKQRYDTAARAAPADDGDVKCEEDGKAVVEKGKGVVMERDEGKGKAVVVDEDDDEEHDDEDSDDDDSEDDSVGGLEEDSDFDDDPLAEVDLENVLPSRTRRRAPPPPGSYLVNDMDGDDDEDDDDEEGFD